MSDRPPRIVRDAFVPFHWPGRDARFLGSLPPGMVRHYNLLWFRRRRSWLGLGVVLALATAVLVAAGAGSHSTLWTAAVATAVLLPAWLVFNHFEGRLRRRLIERDHPTLCRVCGYDLRGSPGRCAECGTVPGG